jgi:hypothetical protein
VANAAPAEDKPDLIRADTGQEVAVSVRAEMLGDVAPGTRVALRAARTSSGDVLAEPHPKPEHFRVF